MSSIDVIDYTILPSSVPGAFEGLVEEEICLYWAEILSVTDTGLDFY